MASSKRREGSAEPGARHRYRSLPDALAAYHAGPRTVDARRAKRQPVPRQYSDQVLSAVRRNVRRE